MTGVKINNSDTASLFWLVEIMSDSEIMKHEYQPNPELDREMARYLLGTRNRVGLLIRAIFEAHSCLEDARLALQMASRYPWKNKIVSKHKHLDIVDFFFCNICYIYKEKIKLASNATNTTAKLFGLPVRIDVKFETNAAEAGLRKSIRRRGQSVHEWKEVREPLSMFQVVSFLADHGHREYTFHTRVLYGESKRELASEISEGIKFMNEHFVDFCDRNRKAVSKIVAHWDKLNDTSRTAPHLLRFK